MAIKGLLSEAQARSTAIPSIRETSNIVQHFKQTLKQGEQNEDSGISWNYWTNRYMILLVKDAICA